MLFPGGRSSGYRRYGLLLVYVVAVVLTGCNPQPGRLPASSATPKPDATSSAMPPLKITGHGGTPERPLRFVEQNGNRRLYVLLARSWESRTAQGLAHATFYDAMVTFYSVSGKRLTARAPRAIVDEATKTVQLIDGVVSHTSDGIKLDCDTLNYNRSTDLLHGEGNVRMSNASGMHLTGSRFDSDVTLAKIHMQ